MSLGSNIRFARRRAGLTQNKLAEILHVNEVTVSKWENDVFVPGANTLLNISKALDTGVELLLNDGTDTAASQSCDALKIEAQSCAALKIASQSCDADRSEQSCAALKITDQMSSPAGGEVKNPAESAALVYDTAHHHNSDISDISLGIGGAGQSAYQLNDLSYWFGVANTALGLPNGSAANVPQLRVIASVLDLALHTVNQKMAGAV